MYTIVLKHIIWEWYIVISHSDAISLESIVREVFDCNRGGVMGVADADYLERFPLEAAIAIFAPLYKDQKDIPEIDAFMDEYGSLFHYRKDDVTVDTVKEYIDRLKVLVKNYCE